MAYKHGTYGVLTATANAASNSASVVVYVGTAPINKIAGQAGKIPELVNKPLKITGLLSARKLLGYSEKADFAKYTLCEAVEAHFKNSLDTVGPIYVINVFNPNEGAADAEPVTLTVTKKIAKFTLGDMILDTLAVGEGLTAGTDYELSYDSVSDVVTIKMLGETIPTTVKVSGKVAATNSISATDIIGEIKGTGEKTGLKAIADIYGIYSDIVNVIAAPGFSETPAVYEAMIETAKKLNGHWDAFVNADIPVGASTNTIAKAIAWKKENGYNEGISKVYWPMAKRTDGKTFHLSTLATYEMQKQDLSNDGVPFVSVSNKETDVADFYGGTGFHAYDIEDANILNTEGITTLVKAGGVFRLWGPHTAAFNFEDQEAGELDPVYQFDSSIRTMLHITNRFQADNFDDIDKPMTMALKDQILVREQSKLDTLKSMGALIGEPIVFFSDDNDAESLSKGDFVWDIQTTTATPFKSGTVKVGYTSAGIYTLLGEEA